MPVAKMDPSVKIFLLLLAIAYLGKATLDKVCPENEYWDDCHSHCQPSCKDPHEKFPCIAMCVAGCTCVEGLIRNRETKKCVKIIDCPGYQSEFLFYISANRLSKTS